MSLRIKVFLLVSSVLLLLFFLVSGVLSRILIDDFLELEKQSVEENVRRVSDALDNSIDDLAVKVSDWGQWDDTHDFIEDGNVEYLDANLQDVALELLHIQFVVITDIDGKILFKKEIDKEAKEVAFSEGFEQFIVTHPALTQHDDTKSIHTGVISLPEGVIINVARAVTSSDGLSPVNGTIMFALFVDDRTVEKLSDLTHLKVTLKRFDEAERQADMALIVENLKNRQEVFVAAREGSDTTASGYTLKRDIEGKGALVIGAEIDRSIYGKGQESILFFSKIMIGVGLFMIVVVLGLFEYLVLRRLGRLGDAVEEVSHDEKNQARIVLPGRDEFSNLAKRINTMLASLYELEIQKKESEKRFRTLADSAPVMIWMSDIDKQCTYVNKIWLDYTGRSLAEELGQGWKSAVAPEDMKATEQIFESAFSEQKSFSVEYRLRRKDGTYGWVFSRAVPHFTGDNVFLGYIGSCVDISERKEVENQKQGYIEEIEKINRIMVDRELKMVELKKEIATLRGEKTAL